MNKYKRGDVVLIAGKNKLKRALKYVRARVPILVVIIEPDELKRDNLILELSRKAVLGYPFFEIIDHEVSRDKLAKYYGIKQFKK